MSSKQTPHTATISLKPSGSGSLNLPSDVVEELDAAEDGGTIAIIIEDREVRLVPLVDVLRLTQ